MKKLLFLLPLVLFVTWCSQAPQQEVQLSTGVNAVIVSTVNALAAKNITALSSLVSEKWIRFSPYGYVDTGRDVVMQSTELFSFWNSSNVREWWLFDWSGEPIVLTFKDYFSKFIYDADFVSLAQTFVNQRFERGNIINNVFDVYTWAYIVELYVPGVDPQYDGMDRKSLHLVFVQEQWLWKLRALIHGQWTI